MSGSVLMGPFLTRIEAARAAGTTPLELVVRGDVLRIGGRSLEEVYFAFQFSKSGGVRSDVSHVVAGLIADWDHMTIAHWLARPNPKLDSLSPLAWLDGGRDIAYVIEAAGYYTPATTTAPATIPSKRESTRVA